MPGPSVQSTTLIGYFTKREEARKVFRELQRRGFHRAALVSRTADGHIDTWDPLPWRRILGAIIGFVFFGAITAIAVITLEWPEPIERGIRHAVLPVLAGGLIGVLLSEIWIRRSRFGVDRDLLSAHTRRLVANETVLIVQARARSLQVPVAVLRGSDESRHALFVQHPERKQPAGEEWGPGAPMSLAQIQEHARRLAADHAEDPKLLQSTELLGRLEAARQWIHNVAADLSEANRLEQSVPPTTEWLLDNEYIIESNARDVQKALPRHYYRELRSAAAEPYTGLPLIYGMARELVAHTDSHLNRGNIISAIDAYQSVLQLTLGELWAFPQMLRIALIENIQHLATRAFTELRERERADFWANRLITANRRDPSQLFSILSELTAAQSEPSAYFASQLIDHLYDEAAALVPVQSWLERSLRKSMTDLHLEEQNRQTKDQIAIGNAFGSLRQLAVLDWRLIFERLSRVEEMLRLDPAGVYATMEFDTRDRYRRAVETLSRRSGRSEEAVTEQALEMAAQALRKSSEDKRAIHVGTYLIGEGRRKLAHVLACTESPRYRALDWVYRHHTAVYFVSIGFLASLVVGAVFVFGLQAQPLWVTAVIVLLALFPGSQLGLDIVNYLATRLLPPRVLPKLDFSVSGIPDAFRTLVVVPVMLRSRESVQSDVERLEIRYLANKESNLLFGLFTDYTDAKEAKRDHDESLISAARKRIEALNEQYGGARFFLFHRNRTWCETEQAFIGWERKRGKLEELNGLIDGTRPDDAEPLVYVGNPDHLANVRFVITLDADTQLPRGAAHDRNAGSSP
jgi:cyclic beta-1,2-glucan synthetase